MTSVVIVNSGTFVKDPEIGAVASAIEGLVRDDFARFWSADATVARNLPCSVRAASAASPPKPDEWLLGLYVESDRAGALGYHAKTSAGLSRRATRFSRLSQIRS